MSMMMKAYRRMAECRARERQALIRARETGYRDYLAVASGEINWAERGRKIEGMVEIVARKGSPHRVDAQFSDFEALVGSGRQMKNWSSINTAEQTIFMFSNADDAEFLKHLMV